MDLASGPGKARRVRMPPAGPVRGNGDCSVDRPASVCVASHIVNAATPDHIVNVANRANEVRVRMDEPPRGSTKPPRMWREVTCAWSVGAGGRPYLSSLPAAFDS